MRVAKWRPSHTTTRQVHAASLRVSGCCVSLKNNVIGLHYLAKLSDADRQPISVYNQLLHVMATKGANINQRKKSGETPLHVAAMRGNQGTQPCCVYVHLCSSCRALIVPRSGCVVFARGRLRCQRCHSGRLLHGDPLRHHVEPGACTTARQSHSRAVLRSHVHNRRKLYLNCCAVVPKRRLRASKVMHSRLPLS